MGNNFPLTDRTVSSTENYYLPNMALRSDYNFSATYKYKASVTSHKEFKKTFLYSYSNVFIPQLSKQLKL